MAHVKRGWLEVQVTCGLTETEGGPCWQNDKGHVQVACGLGRRRLLALFRRKPCDKMLFGS